MNEAAMWEKDYYAMKRERDALQAQNQAQAALLVEAIKGDYFDHHAGCEVRRSPLRHYYYCDCGFDEFREKLARPEVAKLVEVGK